MKKIQPRILSCQADIKAISIEPPIITYDPTPDADLAPPLLPLKIPRTPVLIPTSILEALKRKYPSPNLAIHHLPLSKGGS